MRKVLITGANGFLGVYLVSQMLEKGYKVIGTGKGPWRGDTLHPGFTYETMDFTEPETVSRVFQKHAPDIVIHCGAVSKPDECEINKEMAFRANVTGTSYLLKEAARLKAMFIFLSTDFVFDGIRGMYSEEDETGPVNYYGETKVLAETEVKNYPFNWVIARTVLVYGKTFSERQNIVTNTAMALRRGDSLKIFNDQVRTPTYVEDLARGIVTMVERNVSGIYHLSGKDVITPYGIALAVAEYLHIDPAVIKSVSQDEFDQPAKRPLRTGFNLSKAERDLDYACVSFADGLRRTLG